MHRDDHPGYEFFRHDLVPAGKAEECAMGLYKVPPGKSAYPYHYHLKNEEVFYILSGKGLLRTPSGERVVGPGESIFFPACEAGAHKITNISADEMLVYLDFDVRHDLDVCFYPDSGKVGIWGRGVRELHKVSDQVGYYDGE
jgi:uncharacterized cupin superfamily protein